jgi:hypothetical protein
MPALLRTSQSARNGHSKALTGYKMGRYRFFLALLIAYYGCAAAAEQSDRIGSKRLPDGAVLMCAEHVNGDASGKSMHIMWQAFGLNETIDKTAQFYQAKFGQPPSRDDAGRYIWKFKDVYSELIYSVQPSLSAGPWSGCSNQPSKFKTVVLISNGTWAKEP